MIKVQHRDGCSKAWSLLAEQMKAHHIDWMTHCISAILFKHNDPCGSCWGRYEKGRSTMTGRIYRTTCDDELARVRGENWDNVE